MTECEFCQEPDAGEERWGVFVCAPCEHILSTKFCQFCPRCVDGVIDTCGKCGCQPNRHNKVSP